MEHPFGQFGSGVLTLCSFASCAPLAPSLAGQREK